MKIKNFNPVVFDYITYTAKPNVNYIYWYIRYYIGYYFGLNDYIKIVMPNIGKISKILIYNSGGILNDKNVFTKIMISIKKHTVKSMPRRNK